MLPKGTYAAVVVPMTTEFGVLGCQFGKSQNKGTLQVLVTFEVLRGPQAGQRIGWFGYFTDATTERTLEALRLCGFTGDDLDKFADQKPENEVEIVVDHETYDGKVRAKVQWVNAPGGGIKMTNPLNGSELRKFGAQFKAKLKTLPAIQGKKAEREAPTAAPAGGDNDWSGNDAPDPPKDDEIPPPGDDQIPF